MNGLLLVVSQLALIFFEDFVDLVNLEPIVDPNDRVQETVAVLSVVFEHAEVAEALNIADIDDGSGSWREGFSFELDVTCL